jgi:uncharacterized protein
MIGLMEIVVVALLGLVAGFISALSTGGGLITLPALLLLGLSPVSAIATSRFGAVSAALSSTYRYYKGRAIAWQYMPYFLALAVVAGVIGPHILLTLNQNLVEKGVSLLLLSMLPLLFLQKEVGAKTPGHTRERRGVGLCLIFVVLLYMTMFGPGSGILGVYVLVYMFGMGVVEATATCTVMALVGSSVALVSYIMSGSVVFHLAIPLAIGAFIGGYLGANTALKKGSTWVKWLLAIVIIISSLKLLIQ